MRALTVLPGTADSARLDEVPLTDASSGALLVQTIAMGVCGTDVEILQGHYGTAPSQRERLILGHESLGRVVEAPSDSGFRSGDHVVGIVRRPDPLPCDSCAVGEWDMCRNGQYTERGIRAHDGFGSEWFRIEPEYAVRVPTALGITGVLLEPASVLAKAWEQVERIGARSAAWRPRSALITGAGPVGLLGALMAVQRGLEVHVYDRATEDPKPALVHDLGATYHSGAMSDLRICPDIVLECTGAVPVISDVLQRTGPVGIVCLTGISTGGRAAPVDLGLLNRTIVLENDVIFGSVNANRRHYEAAAAALAGADPTWLQRLINRRVPLDRWEEAFQHRAEDVKVVIEFPS